MGGPEYDHCCFIGACGPITAVLSVILAVICFGFSVYIRVTGDVELWSATNPVDYTALLACNAVMALTVGANSLGLVIASALGMKRFPGPKTVSLARCK